MQRENNNTVGGRKPVGVMNALMAYSAGLRDAARVSQTHQFLPRIRTAFGVGWTSMKRFLFKKGVCWTPLNSPLFYKTAFSVVQDPDSQTNGSGTMGSP